MFSTNAKRNVYIWRSLLSKLRRMCCCEKSYNDTIPAACNASDAFPKLRAEHSDYFCSDFEKLRGEISFQERRVGLNAGVCVCVFYTNDLETL